MPLRPATCPECGARRGDPHKSSCSHAQVRRRGQAVPQDRGKGRGKSCPPHDPYVSKTGKNGQKYYKCRTCSEYLGKGI